MIARKFQQRFLAAVDHFKVGKKSSRVRNGVECLRGVRRESARPVPFADHFRRQVRACPLVVVVQMLAESCRR